MRERVAIVSAIVLGLGLWEACSRPADPGYYDPPPEEPTAGGTNTSSGGSTTSEPEPVPEPEPEPEPSLEPSPEEPDPGSVPNEGEESPDPEATAPNYEPAVIMDDGVLHIWTLGDSITVGVNGGFRNDLYNMLTADGYDVDLVGTQFDDSAEIDDKDHEGHTAYTFELTRQDVDGWLAQVHRPDIVLMLLGANDFAWWTNLEPKEHLVFMMDLVDHLVDTLPGAGIIVATLTPQSSEMIESVNLNRTDMVDEFDDLLRDRLPQHPEYGKHVFMADLGASIELSELYDGIHPTRAAHREIASIWYDVVKQILAN